MNPKQFKYPFSWEERAPQIVDRVLFVPRFYAAHQEWNFPGWEAPEVFGRTAPLAIEYCSGNGLWVIEKAKAHPEINWIAVEKRFDRVRKIWSKRSNENIPNLLVVCGDALTFTQFYLKESSVDQIYINFPDPWPKEKHAKNRLIQEPFVSEMARVLKEKGKAVVVTDDVMYQQRVIESMMGNPQWSPSFSFPHFVTEWEGYGTSYFDALWREQGCTIHYLKFQRKQERIDG
jgi:tRNA (guanine-N7-)-methyltransferase